MLCIYTMTINPAIMLSVLFPDDLRVYAVAHYGNLEYTYMSVWNCLVYFTFIWNETQL